ncbi:P-loop containing nucleoside triphosphate hydrolase protein [Parasitella parasitica]|nr:P-loop containing nucleoside triphosphate hydrolase protein [Parasitella parasitica]
MKVINASLGRTGTSSFSLAMNSLGYKCHHLKEMKHSDFKDSELFYNAAVNRDTADWDKVYAGYDACADFTGAYFYKHLFAKYPDAKVILTERDFQDWFTSMENTIWPALKNPPPIEEGNPRFYYRKLVQEIICDGPLQRKGEDLDREAMKMYYENHIKQVKELIPADQLYVYKLGEGWDGLCKFLDKNVPVDMPYPKVNSAAQFNAHMKETKAKLILDASIKNLEVCGQ